MPRKEYKLKNPYCRRSKLNELEFEVLVYCYFFEMISGRTREYIQEFYVEMLSKLLLSKGVAGVSPKPLSRQAFGTYFERLGNYIWNEHLFGKIPTFPEDFFNDLIELIYGKIDKISSYKIFYNEAFNSFPLFLNEEKIASSLMFQFLSNRSKVTRGFKKDKFYLEFSRACFICAVIDGTEIKLQSIYSPKLLKNAARIMFNSSHILLKSLKENPM